MQRYLGYFTPTLEQFLGLLAVLAVCACITVIGAAIGQRKRLFELDLVTGWALVSFLFVLAGGWADIDFRIIIGVLVGILVVSGAVLTRRAGPFASGDLLRTCLLATPMIWLAGCMMMSQWDDFTHWMPNAWYIVEHNTLPGDGKPPATSGLPGYPHGLSFIVYLSSRIVGFLTENAIPVFNILLLASLAVLIGRVIRTAMEGVAAAGNSIGWVYCAVGALAVTGFNPTFVPKIVFTSYVDNATGVLVGILCIVMWMLLNALSKEDDRYPPQSLAWSYGLAAMAAVSVKQPNIVLVALITIGGLLVAWRDPNISLARLIRLLPVMIAPPVTIYLLWRAHVSFNDVAGEVGFLPMKEWMSSTDQILTILSSMVTIISKKGGYFFIMFVACGIGVRALWRMRSPLDRLCLIIATAFVGYNAFLFMIFVTAFGTNGLEAPGLWRFNMHLGGTCVAFAAFGIALFWRARIAPRLRYNIGWIAFVLIVVAPFTVAYKIRFDQYSPKVFVRAVSEEIVETIPKGVRFAALDTTGIGDLEVIARYVITPHVDYVGFLIRNHRSTVESLGKFFADKAPQFVWINVPTETLEKAMGLTLPPRHSYLIEKAGTGWKIRKAWPFPGFDDPHDRTPLGRLMRIVLAEGVCPAPRPAPETAIVICYFRPIRL